jgi:hypothetical protein
VANNIDVARFYSSVVLIKVELADFAPILIITVSSVPAASSLTCASDHGDSCCDDANRKRLI